MYRDPTNRCYPIPMLPSVAKEREKTYLAAQLGTFFGIHHDCIRSLSHTLSLAYVSSLSLATLSSMGMG